VPPSIKDDLESTNSQERRDECNDLVEKICKLLDGYHVSTCMVTLAAVVASILVEEDDVPDAIERFTSVVERVIKDGDGPVTVTACSEH
jgi:hypothetical protein